MTAATGLSRQEAWPRPAGLPAPVRCRQSMAARRGPPGGGGRGFLLIGSRLRRKLLGLRVEREPAQAGPDGSRLLRARGEAACAGVGPRGALSARGGEPARGAGAPGNDRARRAGRLRAGHGLGRGGGGGARPRRRLGRAHRRRAQRARHRHILALGSDEQKRRWLPQLATGERAGGVGPHRARHRAPTPPGRHPRRTQGNGWVLNGSKTFITQGSVGDVFVVLAVDRRRRRSRTASPPSSLEKGMPGLPRRQAHREDGHARLRHRRAGASRTSTSPTRTARRGRPRLHRHAEDPRQGPHRHRVDGARPRPRRAEAARAYASERKQFGQPLADYQAHPVHARRHGHRARRRAPARPARGLAAGPGQPHTSESVDGEALRREAAMRACDRALQIHGGYGYTREFPVERICATPSCARSARAPTRCSAW